MVAGFRIEHPNRAIWRLIHENPVTPESIDILVERGWKVEFKFIGESAGEANLKTKIISIDQQSYDFQRDVTLFHEIVHAWYGGELVDVPSLTVGLLFLRQNRIITEWLARQLRANPKLLRKAIHAFGLEPKMYDKISYLAFVPDIDLGNFLSGIQSAFPFIEEHLPKDYLEWLENIKMD